MNKLIGFAAPLPVLFSVVAAFADPEAVRVAPELMSDPQVRIMVDEYNRIAAANPKVCGDKKLFGLRTVKIDGQLRVRYYVDGKGIGCIPSRLQPRELWTIKPRLQDQAWNDQHEHQFSQFVEALGTAVAEGRCSTTDTCMISSANILRTANDEKAFHYADCADFPFFLRAYYHFRKNLPYAFSSQMRARRLTPEDQEMVNGWVRDIKELEAKQQTGGVLTTDENNRLEARRKQVKLSSDPRYTINGNWVANKVWIWNNDQRIDFYQWVHTQRNAISTATLRVWRNENENKGELNPDFYSPRLDRGGIKAGTVIYKTDGHTAIVYKVDPTTGAIHYIDAHPDNSISHGILDETWIKGFMGRANHGGGFKNFRPNMIFKTRSGGFWGRDEERLTLARDEQIGHLISDEQYRLFPHLQTKLEWQPGHPDSRVGYLDFLRLRLSNGNYRIDPVTEFTLDVKALCTSMQSRRNDVAVAVDKGFHLAPHPEKLPDNIYGAQGDWEKYSTPGRDVVFRQRVLNLAASLTKYKDMVVNGHFLLSRPTTVENLKADLRKAWADVAGSCEVSYENSRGEYVGFDLIEAIRRSPDMAFDPYLCPERRFGAPASTGELATCTDTPDKADWYTYQQFLRNRTEKTPGEPMGWSLQQLRAKGGDRVDPELVRKLDIGRAIDEL